MNVFRSHQSALERVAETHTERAWSVQRIEEGFYLLLDGSRRCFGKLQMNESAALATAAAPELQATVRDLLDRFAQLGADALDTPAAKAAIYALERVKAGGQRDVLTTTFLSIREREGHVLAVDRQPGGWTVLHHLTADPHHEVVDRNGARLALLLTTDNYARIISSAVELRSALWSLINVLRHCPCRVAPAPIITTAVALLVRAGGAVQ